jgi:nicotinate-nucleotide adenylyltransferase
VASLVPANPLKLRGPAPLDKRLAHAKRLIDHPRIVIT